MRVKLGSPQEDGLGFCRREFRHEEIRTDKQSVPCVSDVCLVFQYKTVCQESNKTSDFPARAVSRVISVQQLDSNVKLLDSIG